MKCISCNEEVSSRFTAAYAQNACPFCGQHIMHPEMQKSLNDLREVMTTLSERSFLSEAFDWLKSNFDLISTNSDEYQSLLKDLTETKERLTLVSSELEALKNRTSTPIPRSGKGLAPPGTIQMGKDAQGNPVQLTGEALQSPETTNKFIQRAQAGRVMEKHNDVAALAKQIRKSGGVMENMVIPELDDIIEDQANYPAEPYSGEDEIDPIMLQYMDPKASTTYNPRDVAKLQRLQEKVAGASRDLSETGSVGLIRR